ncbi:HAD-IA family hydrolase [Halomonas sp. NO4]|uniref:HAD family hydrolase n=1 Tax=Halomonas sp. NO4 TaxID=2484813 RepID=UPI0013D3FEA9|nr:HAD-IA family hydrolase [Halomonas sp. NO4]
MRPSQRIRALTFDLDDTLWDNRQVMVDTENGHYAWLDAALANWLAGAGRPPTRRFAEHFPLTNYVARRQALAAAHPLRRGDFTWLRREALATLLTDYGLAAGDAERWAEAAMQRFLALRHRVTPYPEVDELLTRLSRAYRLASITNGNVDVRRLPLATHFPVAIAAGELLAPKPHPRPFLTALAQLNTPPARALHVGDSWRDDVAPARRLGMQAVWIATEAPARPLPPGVHRLEHVRELPALLDRLEE